MDQIDIGTVLNKFNDTVDEATQEVKTFGIRFINKQGEKRVLICRKNVKSPKQEKADNPQSLAQALSGHKIEDKGREMYNLKRNGVMLVKDEHEDHPRTIKTSMIYAFKDFNSDNWLNVFH
jgi:hypothetical protein